QLNGRLVAFFDVIARVTIVAIAGEKPLVRRIQAQLWQVLVVHDDQPLIAMLDKSDVRFNQPRRDFVVLESRARIKGANVIERSQDRFYWPSDRASDLFELLQCDCAQMLIYHGHGIFHDLFGGTASVSVLLQLREMVPELIK